MRGKNLKLGGVAVVVLDEADEMLDMGFAEDIESILSETPKERQTVLFSATLPPRIAAITKRHLTDPVRINIATEPTVAGTAAQVRQTAYIVPHGHKLATLGRVLDAENPTSAIVFCRRRNEVDELAENLNARGYRAEALHGGMTQEQRNRVMKRFRSEASDLLIATDVAARGLDIQHLSHVINFDVPAEAESYIHRIGRVGRAGREGVAITLAEPREHRQIRGIERTTGQKIEIAKVPTVADLRARRSSCRGPRCARPLSMVISIGTGSWSNHWPPSSTSWTLPWAPSNCSIRPTVPRTMKTTRFPRSSSTATSRPAIPRQERARDSRGDKRPHGESRGGLMTRLYVGAGRAAGVRAQDLVGAVTGEAGLTGRQVGDIDISDRFSLVEVPEDLAEAVITAPRASKIKGRKVTVRRERPRK